MDGLVGSGPRGGGNHPRWEPAAILADLGQLVDVLNPAGGLEDDGVKPGRNRRAVFRC